MVRRSCAASCVPSPSALPDLYILNNVYSNVLRVLIQPGAPVVQLVTSKPSDVGTWVRISAQPHELGFFLKQKKIMPNKWRTRFIRGYTKLGFTVDEGKERLSPSRDKNLCKHRRRKVEKSCVTPAGASTSLTSRINGMTFKHTTQYCLPTIKLSYNNIWQLPGMS